MLTDHDDNLLIISRREDSDNFLTITKYSLKLEVIERVGQGQASMPFYLPASSIESILLNDKYLI